VNTHLFIIYVCVCAGVCVCVCVLIHNSISQTDCRATHIQVYDSKRLQIVERLLGVYQRNGKCVGRFE
jgi:hypothetical protein